MVTEQRAEQLSELPSTSDTDDLLDGFLHWKGSMFDFARSIGFTIMQVLAWWNLEETQAAVKALETLSDARTKLLARLSAPAAIECASKVSEDPSVKPPERRRAAALVLRHAAHRAERRKPPVSHSPSMPEGAGGRVDSVNDIAQSPAPRADTSSTPNEVLASDHERADPPTSQFDDSPVAPTQRRSPIATAAA